MCQTLGYHRRSRMENYGEKAKTEKERLFWSVYRLDKALSLRLGRTPVVVEYDVALPSEPTVRRWIKFADIQAETYSQLYSCVASRKREAERMEMAGALSVELQMLLDQQHKSNVCGILGSLVGVSLIKATANRKFCSSGTNRPKEECILANRAYPLSFCSHADMPHGSSDRRDLRMYSISCNRRRAHGAGNS